MVRRMNLLAIDTALDRCSVGVAAGGRPPVLVSETIGRGHAERLFGMVSAAMAEAGLGFPELQRIAVTLGPGSFTGVRVGIAAARGFALVTGCPVAGIGTLDVIAETARAIAGAVPVMAVLDAKRDEVYAQAFDGAGRPLSAPAAGPAAGFGDRIVEGMVLAGSGARLVAASLPVASALIVHEDTAPDIAALVRLGLVAPPPAGPPRPLYLRPPDARPQAAAMVARR
jgi:tRNA threonylcarbamoyl adenosine modification protein YeaZ